MLAKPKSGRPPQLSTVRHRSQRRGHRRHCRLACAGPFFSHQTHSLLLNANRILEVINYATWRAFHLRKLLPAGLAKFPKTHQSFLYSSNGFARYESQEDRSHGSDLLVALRIHCFGIGFRKPIEIAQREDDRRTSISRQQYRRSFIPLPSRRSSSALRKEGVSRSLMRFSSGVSHEGTGSFCMISIVSASSTCINASRESLNCCCPP